MNVLERVGRGHRSDTTGGEASTAWKGLIRAGFVARGVTYALIGTLALAIAAGAGTGGHGPNQQGALALIASAPLGGVLLVAIALGVLGYATWKLCQGVRGRGPEGGGSPKPGERAANVGGGIAYLALCGLAIEVLVGGGSSSGSGSPRHAAAGVLSWPGGQVIVGLVGAAIMIGAVVQIFRAIGGKFAEQNKTEQMSHDQRATFLLIGRIGQIARAVAFALIGIFLIKTAVQYNAADAVGLDGALERLRNEPLGPLWLGLVAAGLILFAVFSLFEARYRRL